MSYSIVRYNGTAITTVPDGTINSTALDLTLIGKNYAGYGQKQNENFVYLLENFSSSSSPTRPLSGQLWFDSSTNFLKLNVYTGTQWKTLAINNVTTSSKNTVPDGALGDLWYDQVTDQLRVFNGSEFTLVGPEAVLGYGKTQMRSLEIEDTSNRKHAVQAAYVDDQIVYIVSSSGDFTPKTAISGFTQIFNGVTLNSSDKLNGTSTNADNLGNQPASFYAPLVNPNFPAVVSFADAGFEVDGALSVTSTAGVASVKALTSTIKFQTTSNSSTINTPIQLVNNDVLPGTNATTSLGSSLFAFRNIYAGYIFSTVQKADSISVNGQYQVAGTSATPSTIAARDQNGNITALRFIGKADDSLHADEATHSISSDTASLANVASYVEWTGVGNKPTNFVYEDNNQTAWRINIRGTSQGIHTGNVTGNVVGNLVGDTFGVHTGTVQGDVTGNVRGNITGNIHTAIDRFQGPLTGNVTGNVTGTVTGNLIGNSQGTHNGPVIGNVTGNLAGNVTGNVLGNVTGNVLGNVTGTLHIATDKFQGNLTGNVTGNLTGNVTGNTAGAHFGPSTGLHTGDVVGTATNAINQSGGFINATTGSFTGLVTLGAGTGSGLAWPNNSFGGTGDTASISLESAGGEDSRLTFRISNDAGDQFRFYAPSINGMTMNDQVVLNAGNFNNYSPTRTGLGASGVWAITVLGTSNGVANLGNITAESNGSSEPNNQLTLRSVYNNGYPTAYGNVITLGGNGGGELLVGWSGSSGAHADNFVRSRRDVGTTWSPWAKILTDQNFGNTLARVASTGSYTDLSNKPYIPPRTNSPYDQLQNIVKTIVGSIDLYVANGGGGTSSDSSGYQTIAGTSGYSTATYGGGAQTTHATVYGSTVTLTISLPNFLGLSRDPNSLYYIGNYDFNVHSSLTRIYDGRGGYGTSPVSWGVSCAPVTIDRNSYYYGQFNIVVAASGNHGYWGTNLGASWLGITSRTNNVYTP